MTYFQLPSGKTVLVDLFTLLDSDADLFIQELIAEDEGFEINNPFCKKSNDSIDSSTDSMDLTD